jgi:putative ABC transport system permease protein
MDREFTEEAAFHLDMETNELIRSGLNPREARRQANLAFGGVERFRETAREARGARPLEDLVQDIRYAFRTFRKRPLSTLVVVGTLGLGIGACSLIFSVAQPVLIAPLPYPDADQLVVLHERSPEPEGRPGWVSPLTFRDWRERNEVFEDLVSYRLAILNWTDGGGPALIRGWAVSASFFPLMGVAMTLGRGFTEAEDRLGGEKVVVISHGFWTRSFGSDPAVLGQSLVLDEVTHTIVGVAGPELDFPSRGDYWYPAAIDYSLEFRDFRYLGVLGRIRPGVGIREAKNDLDRLSHAVAAENPDTNRAWGAELRSLKDFQVGRIRPVLLGMAAAVAMLFFIAVGNIINLTIARATGRRVETAIRNALGASNRALGRLHFSEALLTSLAGSTLGLALAFVGLRILSSSSLLDLPRGGAISLGLQGALVGTGIGLMAGLVLGGVAILVTKRVAMSATLRTGGAGGMSSGRTHGVRDLVLTGQVALALTLLVGASILTQSLLSLSRVDPGFDPSQITTFSYDLPSTSYSEPNAVREFLMRVMEQAQSTPGIDAAGVVTPLPMEMGSTPTSWSLPPDVREPDAGPVMAHQRMASSGYFDAMGLHLLAGRFLNRGDRSDSEAVVLVNQAFVDTYLPTEDPLGVRITWGEPDAEASEWATIVGIVGDVRFRSLREQGEPEIYLPASQFPNGWGHIVVRSGLPREALVQLVTEAVQDVDPNIPLSDIKAGDEIIRGQLRTSMLSALLTAIFAGTAAVLALVGILGVLSLLVAQRMREIGLRMALGASVGSIWAFVLIRGMRPVLIGLGLGVLLGAGGTRLLESQLHNVNGLDLPAFLIPLAGLASATFLACLVPGARAVAANPVSLFDSE